MRKYAPFVWSNAPLDCVPAFAYHDVTFSEFSAQLEFLSRNGYRTLTVDEYVERVSGVASSSRKEVLLTFDDGRRSLYDVVFDLLCKHGMKATAYIVAGMTTEHTIGAQTDPRYSLCTWPMLRDMHESGVVDVQSHSMWHNSIPVSGRVLDFVTPGSVPNFLDSDLSMWGCSEVADPITETPHLGFPIHAWGARMGPRPAYREHPDVNEACTSWVSGNGDAEFFKRPGWRRELRNVMSSARRRYGSPTVETRAEQARAMLADLKTSKDEIESRLPGHRVGHYCFPWFKGSRLAAELSLEAGYRSNAWASLLSRDAPRGLRAPVAISRLPPKFIWRLPGEGRKPLAALYA